MREGWTIIQQYYWVSADLNADRWRTPLKHLFWNALLFALWTSPCTSSPNRREHCPLLLSRSPAWWPSLLVTGSTAYQHKPERSSREFTSLQTQSSSKLLNFHAPRLCFTTQCVSNVVYLFVCQVPPLGWISRPILCQVYPKQSSTFCPTGTMKLNNHNWMNTQCSAVVMLNT